MAMDGRQMMRMLDRALQPLKRRVMLMVARAVLTGINDATKAQTLQAGILEGETRDDIERFQEYGYTSVPSPGVEALAVFVAGNRAHPVVVATEDRENRPTDLTEGEVALYTKQNQKRVYLKEDGEVHLGTDPTAFVALADLVDDRLSKINSDIQGIVTAITNGVPVAQDGGAALQASIVAALTGIPQTYDSVEAEEVKAK